MATRITESGTAFVTFYSFKGGVGRSMALINVAGIMAGRGLKVLALDMDLEAPGISYLMRHKADREAENLPGFIDLLSDACERGENADLFALAPTEVVQHYSYRYSIPDEIRKTDDGLLRIMPAGKFDGQYQERLDRLDFGKLYRDGQGKPLVKAFKEIVAESELFDFVFVDSRTGFSDESGICTRDLGDYLVVVMGLNRQNEEGTAEFLRSLSISDAEPKGIRVVLSPVPNGEDELVEQREREAAARLSKAYGAPVPLSLQIPYHPRLALTEEPHIFRRSRGYLYDAYAAIEREVLTMMGVTVRNLSMRITAAASKKNLDQVMRSLRHLAKLDHGANSIGQLVAGELQEMVLDEASSELRHYLASTLPADTWIVPRLAIMLHSRKNEDAGLFYDRALEADPENVGHLSNYANFLTDIRKDHDGAAALHRRALDADPENAAILGNYALFLTDIQKNHDGAEALYQRVLGADPENADQLGNYAKLLFITARSEEANTLLARAWKQNPTGAPLQCELHFYACAHLWDEHPEALASLKALLESGERSENWPLEDNVRVAKESEHPHPEFIEALAKVVSGHADLNTLDRFEVWQRGHF